jgi:hypothetical protein
MISLGKRKISQGTGTRVITIPATFIKMIGNDVEELEFVINEYLDLVLLNPKSDHAKSALK